MNYSFTFQERHYNILKDHLLREDGKERAAFIICGRSQIQDREERFLSRELFLLEDHMLLTSEKYQVSWDNKYFIELLKKNEKKGFAIALIHNHPSGINNFSQVDDEGESHLFRLAYNRNGGTRPYASLVIMPDGFVFGRAWKHDLTFQEFSLIRVVGPNIRFWYPSKGEAYNSPEIFNRQHLAFGSSLIQDLSKLKIAVVGAGATGSATATLLARLGVGKLILIDNDKVELSNLSRLHGATIKDVGLSKVGVLKDNLVSFGLGTFVISIDHWVSHPDAILALKECDIIFNCTDDHAGRIILNRYAYFYLTPVIDMGLVISVREKPLQIQDLQGRISFLFPGGDCLLSKGIVNPDIAYSENLRREDPSQYEKLKEEAYVIGEGNPSPAVITFTTLVASLAVNDFLNRMVNYNPHSIVPHKLFFFHRSVELTPENGVDKECRICGSPNYWARGDMNPFLDMVL